MPYYIGDVIRNPEKLIVRAPGEFRKSGIEVRLNSRVEELDIKGGRVLLSGGDVHPFDKLVIATGAEPLLPGVPGQDLEGVFRLRTLHDAHRIKSCLEKKKCKKAVILGGGFISMEMCEALRSRGIEVVVINRGWYPVNRWDAEFSGIVIDLLRSKGVEFLQNTSIVRIEKEGGAPLRVVTDRGEIEADIVMLAIGITPNTGLARSAGIKMGESGAIAVNFTQQTSEESVYAAGDCCEVYHRIAQSWVYFPLGDIANKQGRTAGNNIGSNPTRFPGIVGAHAFKLFHLEIASTGLDEKEAVRSGYKPVSMIAWAPSVSKALAEPGDRTGLKLIAEPGGTLLGAQAIGREAVRKIDTLSAALWTGIRLDELTMLDLAYSPPFGDAWDLIHITARLLLKKL